MRIRRVLFATFLVIATTAGAGSPGRCRTYAQSAVADYKQMKKFPKCHVKDDARWQENGSGSSLVQALATENRFGQ